MTKRLTLVAMLMVGCAATDEHGQTTDCNVDPSVCVTLCSVVASEGPSFEYGQRQPFECDGVSLDGQRTMHCGPAFDYKGNVGCCTGDFAALDVEWYSCPEAL